MSLVQKLSGHSDMLIGTHTYGVSCWTWNTKMVDKSATILPHRCRLFRVGWHMTE